MKILYVITRAERGGAQVHLLDLLANLPPEIKPVIATGEDGFLCEEAASLGVPVRRIPHLTAADQPIERSACVGRNHRYHSPGIARPGPCAYLEGRPAGAVGGPPYRNTSGLHRSYLEFRGWNFSQAALADDTDRAVRGRSGRKNYLGFTG